jgi:glycopeptide antibiotics resistance protein
LHLYASPLTAWLYFDQLSFLLNVLLTVPIGLLARFAFPRLAWWVVGVAVLVLSGCVEVAHLVLPLGREATWGDVASNTIGGFAGAHRTLVDSATGSRRAFRGASRG